jgi:hypothetical protein
MYKGVGIATFSLDTVANNYRPTDLSLAIKQCSVSGGLAEISVTPKFLGEVMETGFLIFLTSFESVGWSI